LEFNAGLAVATLILALLVAWSCGVPFRDPDGTTGPTYIRLPAILVLALVLDIVPRVIHRARGSHDMRGTLREVLRERLCWPYMKFTLVGLIAWYTTYASIRNLKGFVPFVNHHLYDAGFEHLDRALFLGHTPAVVLHQLLGTDAAAHVLSFFYIGWIVLLPFSLAVALVWHRETNIGAWWVTAVAADWVLGVATNFVLPTVGPIYVDPHSFTGLAATTTSNLQGTMWIERMDVLAHPATAGVVQNVAAFASLHVGVAATACFVAHWAGFPRLFRVAMWAFLGVTMIATVYFGWHYVADVVGGLVLGYAGAWIGMVTTGHTRAGKHWARRSDAVVPLVKPY
jgi:hypothetical protein